MLVSEFLIKPASASCNIDCEYCFYKDISNNRDVKDYGNMSLETLEIIVKKAYTETERSVIFGFQGGEPLLVGMDFYLHFFEYIYKYNKKNIPTTVTIQTNGILINDEWAKLFKKYHVLIGISLDGPKDIHNLLRVGFLRKPTHDDVLKGIECLKKYHVEFNVLTVISKYVARNITGIYQYFKEQEFNFLQFIEVLDRKFIQDGMESYSLNNDDYYLFLSTLFELWYDDILKGRYISIRNFDVMIHKLLGNETLVPCFNKGVCQNQNIIEANGDVFSCDFYVTEKYVLGNILDDSLENILKNKRSLEFIKESTTIPDECKRCKYFSLCRNGCKRYRINGKYYYCEAIYKFYDNYINKLLVIKEIVKNNI